MSATEALEAARAGGARSITTDGVTLHVEPSPPPDILEELRQHKPAIIELLQRGPSVAEYQACMSHFRKHPQSATRFRHDQACWAAEMFLSEWGVLASEFGWPIADLFSRAGLFWWLGVEVVCALGAKHAVTEAGRVFDRKEGRK
jgi:hypothetical protein